MVRGVMRAGLAGWLVVAVPILTLGALPGATLVPVGTPRAGQVAEWRLEGGPKSAKPFDPDVMAIDATVTEPGGRSRTISAFWYQSYQRELRDGAEQLTALGAGEWRLRYFPSTPGAYVIRVLASENGEPVREIVRAEVAVEAPAAPVRGHARIASDGQFFATADGRALPLIGADTCWHGRRGTYDYDDWFPAMAASGWNWGRLWMAPWAFGIETAPTERQNYRLDRAWQLDRVFRLAEERGLFLLLCLDYHGMFETEPDFWGGNNFWTRHPYNLANGGPCATPRAFFTEAEARRLYQKRLRYLIGRYGASPALFAWQFFNEIDNVYRHLDPGEVASWHQAMGTWLKANDPWEHLVTTSLTGGSDRPEIWSLPALDLATYHSYNEPAPARRLASVVQSMRERYRKPVLVAEAGVDFRGWARDSDPFLRGFRQLLWGGVMSGSAGTSMSWWWESIHAENVYPFYRALADILARTGWGRGSWIPAQVRDHGPAPARLGEALPDGELFDTRLDLDTGWGTKPTGRIAVANPLSAGEAARRLNAFVHGSAHADLRVPFQIDTWVGDGARLVLHVNSVSSGAILAVRLNGAEVFRRSLPNRDGKYDVNNEYNEDVVVDLPVGRQLVEIRNLGSDWFYLDWVRIERVRPARYEGDWEAAPAVTGVRQGGELLLQAIAPGLEYPAQATVAHLAPSTGARIVVSNLPAGDYAALWFQPTNGVEIARNTARVGTNGLLALLLPTFSEAVVGHVFTPPTLRAQGFTAEGGFRIALQGVRPEVFTLEAAEEPATWTVVDAVPSEVEAVSRLVDPDALAHPRRFYRLRFQP